ncbi:MAG: hypothetical protein JWM31_2434, partial [Solirubrobacterales bacterium]|nr:hypothetical protein [Solirubrobacterales bacterium]
AGPAGAKGADGAKGANGATNVVIRKSSFTVADGAAASGSADCKTGERATGGGVYFPNDALDTIGQGDAIVESVPTSGQFAGGADGATPNGWFATVFDRAGGGAATAEVYAICAAP